MFPCITALHVFQGTYARTKEISRNASVIDVEMHFDAFSLTWLGQSGEACLVGNTEKGLDVSNVM